MLILANHNDHRLPTTNELETWNLELETKSCFWGHSLNENNHREVAKAVAFLRARAGNGSSMQACSTPRGVLH